MARHLFDLGDVLRGQPFIDVGGKFEDIDGATLSYALDSQADMFPFFEIRPTNRPEDAVVVHRLNCPLHQPTPSELEAHSTALPSRLAAESRMRSSSSAQRCSASRASPSGSLGM